MVGGNSYGLTWPNASVRAEVDNALSGKGNCLDQIKDCYRTQNDLVCSSADTFCAKEVENPFDVYLERDEYDARFKSTDDSPDPFPYNYYKKYLNQPEVQAALGVYTNYTDSSPTASAAFASTGDDARESQTIENIRSILAEGVTVAIYVGDSDYNCNIVGQVEVVDEIAAAGFDKAGFTNLTTSDGIVHGQVKQSGTFSFTRFYVSGDSLTAGLQVTDSLCTRLSALWSRGTLLSASRLTRDVPTSHQRQGYRNRKAKHQVRLQVQDCRTTNERLLPRQLDGTIRLYARRCHIQHYHWCAKSS